VRGRHIGRAEALKDGAIHDNVATKTDLQQVETALRTELRELEQRMSVRFEQVERRIDGMVTRLGCPGCRRRRLAVCGAALLAAAWLMFYRSLRRR
jgi:hypothetical protein